MSLEKQFDFKKLEHSIYKNWEESGCFKPVKNSDTYCIMMPPPNVTGSLHMGHALTFTIQDILIRYNRMKGKEVLWQAGTDHAGIATQMVVERELQRKNIDRKDLGREKFIEKVWEWKKVSGDKISNQLRRLGSSADWSRERFTMDEGLSTAVKKVFVELYNDNIIYKDKRLVNWDPKLLTAVSDLEVDQREQEGHLWHIKYPIDNDNFITVATTRPETMLGDTAVAVHPKDERYKKYIGQHCNLPLTDRKVEIIGDEYADPEKGSGAVKITPAHDFNDFEIGKKNNLEFINIFDKQAKLNENVPNRFQGMDRYEARNKILKELKSLDLLIKEENQIMVVPYGDRSGVVIEPWLTDQWFCDAKRLSIDPIKSVKNEKTKFVPKQWEKTFFNWMENIQPWCISRQLWWGHRIPAWYTKDKKIFVAENEQEAKKISFKYYKKNVELRRDNDVLDTWFSSALWPFATLGWPKNTYELKRFYPTSVLVTGFDIIFFWVARMMMMGNHLLKKEPFSKVYVHALVRDEKGQKMSKSKGNVIDPLDVINKYGADSLRFTLISMTAPGRDVKLSEDRVKGYRNFLNKIWNANKFSKINKCKLSKKINIKKINHDVNKWIYFELVKTSNEVKKYIANFRFDEAARVIYQFVWHSYCDWYIECLKPIFDSKNIKNIKETRDVSAFIQANILILLHPFIPFFTEKVWQDFKFANYFNKPLMFKDWEIKSQSSFSKNHSKINWLIDLVTNIRSTKVNLNVSPGSFIDVSIAKLSSNKIGIINDNLDVFKRLGRVSNVSRAELNKNGVKIIIRGETIILYFDQNLNLQKQKQKILNKVKELNHQINIKNEKMKNKSFLKKAPKQIVDNEKKTLIEYKFEFKKLNSILNSIKN